MARERAKTIQVPEVLAWLRPQADFISSTTSQSCQMTGHLNLLGARNKFATCFAFHDRVRAEVTTSTVYFAVAATTTPSLLLHPVDKPVLLKHRHWYYFVFVPLVFVLFAMDYPWTDTVTFCQTNLKMATKMTGPVILDRTGIKASDDGGWCLLPIGTSSLGYIHVSAACGPILVA